MITARTTISLNGIWDLSFDPENQGKRLGWQKQLPERSEPLEVPGIWELIRPGYDGVAWYRRTLDIKPEWLDGIVRLKFGAVHYFSEIYLNGKLLGTHEGGGSQFEFDITQVVKAGSNRLILRVIGPPSDREVEGFRSGAPLNQSNIPIGKAAWYFNYGGIWQDVELEISGRLFIDNLYVKPQLSSSTAQVRVTVINREAAGRHEIAVAVTEADSGKTVAEVTRTVRLKVGVNEIAFPMSLKDFTAWSCEQPFLYRASATIGADSTSVRFGMRELTIKDSSLVLNGTPIILKGFLQQSIYPRTIIFPDSREMGIKELKLIKDHGFNFIRAHLKAANPWWLDLCDEMGILIEAEPGIGWIINHQETERRCATEINAMLLRDRNHPCIIMWCLLNEAFHFQGFTIPEIKAMTARLAVTGRQIDDTRLLMDTSGGTDLEAAAGGALIWLPNVAKQAVITDDHAYCTLPLQDASIVDYRTRGAEGMPWFISEYGAPLMPPDYRKVIASYRPAETKLGLEDYILYRDFYASLSKGFRQAKLSKSFGNVNRFINEINLARADEIRLITAAQRCNPKLVGTAFCQLADASGEEFGVMDFFRNPKPAFHSLARAMQTPLVAPEIHPRVQHLGQKSSVRLTLVNETKLKVNYSYSLDIIAVNGEKVVVSKGRVRADSAVQTVLDKEITLNLQPGIYALRATLDAGAEHWQEEVAFTVLAAPVATLKKVTLWDPSGVMKTFFESLGVETQPFGNNYRDKNIPVIIDLRGKDAVNRLLLCEHFPQLKKIVQTGGTAVLLNPEPLMLQGSLFDHCLRPTGCMRLNGYVKKHPVFAGLPSDCTPDYVWASVPASNYECGEDIMAAGGEVLAGGFAGNMWTRPADYTWSASLYTLPIGRGEVTCCQMSLLDHLADNTLSKILLTNLANVAAKRIRPGLDHLLFGRCIDPLNPVDYKETRGRR